MDFWTFAGLAGSIIGLVGAVGLWLRQRGILYAALAAFFLAGALKILAEPLEWTIAAQRSLIAVSVVSAAVFTVQLFRNRGHLAGQGGPRG
jgi:hypothetical protein